MPLPSDFDVLRHLCFCRRSARRGIIRQLQRQIAAEKKRLLDVGVDRFYLEALCNYFIRPDSPAGRRAEAYLLCQLRTF